MRVTLIVLSLLNLLT